MIGLLIVFAVLAFHIIAAIVLGAWRDKISPLTREFWF